MTTLLHKSKTCRCVAAACLCALYAVHPILHGTPLDGGVLDGLLGNFQMLMASLVRED